MKKVLLYVFALPIGILLSSILPVIYGNILEHFIPFELISNVLKSYLIPFFSGSILIGSTMFIVPDYKKIIGFVNVILTVILIFIFLEWTVYYFLYLLGNIFAFLIFINSDLIENENIFNN